MQPVQRFPLDAAILFSDILTVPAAMGLDLEFTETEGPRFRCPIRDWAAVDALAVPDPEVELRYVMDAVRLIRHELNGRLPLIGFAGSPWTLATYMVEGGSSRDFISIKTLALQHPDLMHALLDKLTAAVTLYLQAQAAAGAQVLMLFDTWGGVLTPQAYRRHSLAPMARIVKALKPTGIPLIVFTKGGGQWLEDIAATGCDALGLDWTTDLAAARARVGDRVALQGNLDPSVLHATPTRIRAEVTHVLEAYGPAPGHIFNLGHGIQPQCDPEHVAALVEAVHDVSARLRGTRVA